MAVPSKASRVAKAPAEPAAPAAPAVTPVRPAEKPAPAPEVIAPTQTTPDDVRPVSAPYNPPQGPPEGRRVISMNIPESMKEWVEAFAAYHAGRYQRLDKGKVHELLLLHGIGDEGVETVKTFIRTYYKPYPHIG